MKKIDYLIFIGLTISLVAFIYLTSITTSSQNLIVIENQGLIKKALNVTEANSERIIDNQHLIRQALNNTQRNSERIIENQKSILNISRGLQNDRDLLLEHSKEADHEQEENQNMIKELLNNTLKNQAGFAGEHDETQELIRQVIEMLGNDTL